MKAKRYKITIYESVLDITHGFGQTIDEISVGDIFINSHGVFDNYGGRGNGATDVKDIEFDDSTYEALKRFCVLRKFVDKEIKRILKTNGDVKMSEDTPILCFDDFEKRYLPKMREERLKKEETPEQTGERLAKETIARIGEELHKHKKPQRRKK